MGALMNERCYIAVASPLPAAEPLGTVDINPRVNGMQVRSESPMGFTEGTVGIDRLAREGERGLYSSRALFMERPGDIPPNAHLEFYCDGVKVNAGRAVTFSRPGGVVTGVGTVGYGVCATQDGVIQNAAPGDPVLDGALLRQAISEAAPLLTARLGNEPTTSHDPGEFRYQTVRDALDLVSAASGQPWVVFEDMAVQLLSASVPDEPDYAVPFDASVSWDEDWHEVYTHALLIVTDGTGRERRRLLPNPALSVASLGFTRTYPLTSTAENEASALLVAHQWLLEHATPQVSASISRSGGRGLERLEGGEAPPYMVRPGQWVQVGTEPLQRITRTDWDGWRDTLSVTLGAPMRGTLPNILERAARKSRAMANRRDPLSLARGR